MPQVKLNSIPEYRRLSLQQVAEYEDVARREAYNRLDAGDAHELIWACAPNSGRGPKTVRVADAHSLSAAGQERWLAAATAGAVTPATAAIVPSSAHPVKASSGAAPAVASRREGQLVLIPCTPLDRKIAALKTGLPATVADVAVRRYRIVQQMQNHNWAAEGFEDKRSFLDSLARQNHTSIQKIYRWSRNWNRREDLRDLVDERPGPEKGEGLSLNADARAHVLDCFLLRKMTIRQAHESLTRYLTKKQASPGCAVDYLYEIPSYYAAGRFLRRYAAEHQAEVALARQGQREFDDRCAPYISRRAPDCANDVWVTDQKMYDVRLRDGGERVGRIWGVSFLDVCSWKRLSTVYCPVLSSDIVMRAAAVAIRDYGVPRAVHFDLGKEFYNKMFSGKTIKMTGETLFREATGLWDRLGVRQIAAIGRNPKTKIIERWHGEIDQFTALLTGSTGRNTRERPEELAALEAQHSEWKKSGRGGPGLLRIDRFIALMEAWCETEWNARHRGQGRYLRGMTPNEKWNTHQPADGLRRLTQAELDLETADRREIQVARGGQVNVRIFGYTLEYESPVLMRESWVGRRVLALLPRDSFGVVGVYEIETQEKICEATLKPLHDWVPDDRDQLRAQIRCYAAQKRAVRRGLEARRELAEARNPGAINLTEFGAGETTPPGRGLPEISSGEWDAMKRTRIKRGTDGARKMLTAAEISRRALALQEAGE